MSSDMTAAGGVGVDVLAVLDDHAAGIAQAMEGRSARWINTSAVEAGLAEFREARAAVAELIEAATHVDALSIQSVAHGRLRAALSRARGG